jgi:alpha-glucosidase
VLAVFNLSGQPVPLDLAAFGRLTVLDESGFADPGRHLGPFGAIFARIAGD